METFLPSIFGEVPPPKICFQVLIDYNPDHESVLAEMSQEETLVESMPVDTFPHAMAMAESAAVDIRKHFGAPTIVKYDLEEAEDDIYFIVIDGNDEMVASIVIEVMDYRREVIH